MGPADGGGGEVEGEGGKRGFLRRRDGLGGDGKWEMGGRLEIGVWKSGIPNCSGGLLIPYFLFISYFH